MSKKIGIVWADPYNGNMGVAALAHSTLLMLHSILEKNSIKGIVTVIGSKGSPSDVINIDGNKINIQNVFGHNYLSLKYFLRLILSPKKYNLFKIINQNIVFDISGGDSFSDIYGIKRFNAMLNSKRLYNFFKIKQVLLPQTIGPFKSKKLEKKAFDQMAKMEYVFTRDKQSYDYAKSFLPQHKIFESIDIAFSLPFERKNFSSSKTIIGINISGLLWNGGYTKDNQFNLKVDYKELMHEILKYFLQISEVEVHMVPHVITMRDDHGESDYGVSKEIKKKYKDVILAPKFKNPIEAKNYISGLDFFIGARMHSCIGAFSSNVPVFPIAYSRKFNGLFCDTLNYNIIGDCLKYGDDVILEQMKNAFVSRLELQHQIEIANEKIIKPRLIFFKEKITQILMDE